MPCVSSALWAVRRRQLVRIPCWAEGLQRVLTPAASGCKILLQYVVLLQLGVRSTVAVRTPHDALAPSRLLGFGSRWCVRCAVPPPAAASGGPVGDCAAGCSSTSCAAPRWTVVAPETWSSGLRLGSELSSLPSSSDPSFATTHKWQSGFVAPHRSSMHGGLAEGVARATPLVRMHGGFGGGRGLGHTSRQNAWDLRPLVLTA